MYNTLHGLSSNPPTVNTAAFAIHIWNESQRDKRRGILRAGFRLGVAQDGAVNDGLDRRDVVTLAVQFVKGLRTYGRS